MLKIMFGSSLSSLIRAEDEDNLVLLDLSLLVQSDNTSLLC
jgi:hypothetical protein